MEIGVRDMRGVGIAGADTLGVRSFAHDLD